VRRSKLETIARLAKLETDRALRGLGEAHVNVRRIETSLDLVRESSTTSRRLRTIATGQHATADALATAHRHERGLRERDESLTGELVEARDAHEKARAGVAEAKLRVRAIENAIDRRAQRRQLEARRAETRHIDELSRNATRSGENL
jgi:flagellar export protein FliJ